jgi:cell division protein ZapA
MKQLEVQIMGQSYLLGCPEGGETNLRDAVKRVDSAMCKIRDAGKVKARDRIAVLAALNLAFEVQTKAHAAHVLSDAAPSHATKQALTAEPLSDNESARLLALIARVDQALGEDGQLF